MKALAVIWASNEQDFISWSVNHLLDQGLDVEVFDNWSVDLTPIILTELMRSFYPRMRWTPWPTVEERHSSLTSRLKYLEELSLKSDYDWLVNHDVDEIRRTSTGERVIDFIARMDAAGYNAIDHSIEAYAPREGWDGSQNPEEFFTTRLLGHEDERSPHIKCWKPQTDEFWFGPPENRMHAKGVNLSYTGGHQAVFPDRKVAPEKLVLKHYPLRTQAHAERKIAERKRSYSEEELRRGWHRQYANEWWKTAEKGDR